jgi:hypothetical protein
LKQIQSYGDRRTLLYCAFCGGKTGTRDHCPSKVFLDEPYPENLPIVAACLKCNSGFSADEEYLACLLSCVVAGSTEPELQPRNKTARILTCKPALQARLQQAMMDLNGDTQFIPEYGRVSAIVTKLAQGHGLFEMHELCTGKPDELSFIPLGLMSQQQRDDFENPSSDVFSGWPEVGSRAMQRLLISGTELLPRNWINVQSERYRYSATLGQGIEIRIVIQEYLACRVLWS